MSGLAITSIPENPKNTADHLCIPTRSDKKITDKIVAKMGTVNRSDVASGRETRLNPANIHNMQTPPTLPLITCNFTDDVFIAPSPLHTRIGNIIINTRSALKRVITKGCKESLRTFTDACINTIEKPPTIINRMARINKTRLLSINYSPFCRFFLVIKKNRKLSLSK